MWDKVYAQVGKREVEIEEGVFVEVMSFRLIAEVGGRAWLATHVVPMRDWEDYTVDAFGIIMDDMVEFIDAQSGLATAVDDVFKE